MSKSRHERERDFQRKNATKMRRASLPTSADVERALRDLHMLWNPRGLHEERSGVVAATGHRAKHARDGQNAPNEEEKK